jgi:hypothetical protein
LIEVYKYKQIKKREKKMLTENFKAEVYSSSSSEEDRYSLGSDSAVENTHF